MENDKIVISKLNMIQSDIAYIKEHIEDVALTEDDINSIKDARRDLAGGKTKRL